MGKKQTNIYLAEEYRYYLKVKAAKLGITVSEYVKRLIIAEQKRESRV